MCRVVRLFRDRGDRRNVRFSRLPTRTRPHAIVHGGGNFAKFLKTGRALRVIPSTSAVLGALGGRLLSVRRRQRGDVGTCASDLHGRGGRLGQGLHRLVAAVGGRARHMLRTGRYRLERSCGHSVYIVS